MAWIVQEYEGEVHVVPDHDNGEAHVLTDGCWCEPLRDTQEPRMFNHRDELDRLGAVWR